MPNLEELRQVVFAMNANSALGLMVLVVNFIKHVGISLKNTYWQQFRLFSVVMPKFMSHACLVLLPKVEQLNKFTDLRPLSLSNFTNKIISKLLSMRWLIFYHSYYQIISYAL